MQDRGIRPDHRFRALDGPTPRGAEAPFGEVKDHVGRAADAIRKDAAAGRPVVPEVNYRDVRGGSVSDRMRQAIRRTGCAVVRGVFPVSLASEWFAELGEYLEINDYEKREAEKRGLDQYFSALKAGRPQIFNVYWSKPQVMARQDPRLAETRAFLDRMWAYGGVFDPERQCTYADRVRRRQPGDKTLGLSPHMDAGTVERWIDPGYQQVYEKVFAGDWRRYDPFDATHRLETRELPSPAVCSMFRTYQGWTALTRQGPRDGTLRLIPIADGISYVLLRALQDDVAEDDLCGTSPGAPSASAPSGTRSCWPAWSRSRKSSPAIRSGGIPTSATPSAMSTPARTMRASSISARRRIAPRTAPISQSRRRRSSPAARRPTSRRWTSRSISGAAPRKTDLTELGRQQMGF